MKLLSVFPLLLSAGIAISQVSATPVRIVVLNEHFRVGHAAAHNPNPHPSVSTQLFPVTNMHMKPKHGCAGSLRNKVTKVTSWFRVTFGMVPATPNHKLAKVSQEEVHRWRVVRPQVHHHAHISRPHTFTQRLAHALMMLGPWEGRAVAFILGCGIGVLIRMFWVLAVLAVRSARGRRQREEFIEDEVLFEEEEHLLAPPQYGDEFVVTVEEKEVAPRA